MADENFDLPDAEMIKVTRGSRITDDDSLGPDPVEDELAPTRAFAFVDEEAELETGEAPAPPVLVEPDSPRSGRTGSRRSPARRRWTSPHAPMTTTSRSSRGRRLTARRSRSGSNYLFPRTETNWTVGGRAPRRAAAS